MNCKKIYINSSILKEISKWIGILFLSCALAHAQSVLEQQDELHVNLSPVELVDESKPDTPSDPESSTSKITLASTIPNISTSRPSFTDAVTTVPQGSLQSENGATYTDNRDKTYSWTVPETLLRLGITQNTELRFTTPNYIYTGDNQPGNLANNFGDISVGLSHHLTLPGKVDMAFIPILNIPTGANGVSGNAVDPQLRVVFGKNLTAKWFLSGHLDTRWNTRSEAIAHVTMNPTCINYYSFTKKMTGFLEYSGFYLSKGKNVQFLQSGLLYLLTPRQQIDARIAVGLNRNSPDILVGFGYSFRVDGLFGASRAFRSFKR